MAVIVDKNLVEKLLELVSNEGLSVHQLCCKTGSDHRTIKKYIQLIMRIQESPRLKMETIGLRVFVRREK